MPELLAGEGNSLTECQCCQARLVISEEARELGVPARCLQCAASSSGDATVTPMPSHMREAVEGKFGPGSAVLAEFLSQSLPIKKIAELLKDEFPPEAAQPKGWRKR